MELTNGTYTVGGIALTKLAADYGTPLYVYDADKIVAQYQKLDSAFSGIKHQIKFACKALNNINIMKLLHQQGAGIDTVSIQEVMLALSAGIPATDILYTPNSIGLDELREAVKLGVQVNIDNLTLLEQFGQEFGGSVPVCIRINPHIMAGGNANISVGHIDSKFGISIHQIRHLTRLVEAWQIQVNGLHMHTGSEFLDSGVFLTAAEVIFDCAMHFPNLQFIDFGSGFKVAYKEGDYVTDVEGLGKALSERFKQFCAEYGRELEVWFEPGKFLVSESGYLLVQANTIKQTTSTVFVGVNSGQNHLIRPMFYNAYHHIVNITNPEGPERLYSVVGYICETDTLGWDRRLSEVREGDVLAICNAGAYGFTMANNYNSRLRPAEVMVYQGKDYLIRRRERLEDLLAPQIPVTF